MANRYVRTAGGNWSAPATWASTSGGTDSVAVPTSADAVYLDGNSGNCTIDATASSGSLTCTGYTHMLTHTAGITLTVAGAIIFASGMTYTPGAGAIIAWSPTAAVTFTTGGKALNTLNITVPASVTLVISGACTISTLTATPTTSAQSTVLSLGSGQTFTITNTLSLYGNSAVYRLLVQSSTVGTAATLTVTGCNYTGCTNVDLQDITWAENKSGNTDLTNSGANSIGDCGGNSRTLGTGSLVVTASVAQTWMNAAGGGWSNVANWSSRQPLPQDDVNMAVAGRFSTGVTVTADMPRLGRSITWDGVAYTGTMPVFASSLGLFVYGSFILSSSMSVSLSSSRIVLAGRGNYSLQTASHPLYAFWILAPGGTYTLLDAGVFSSIPYVSSGTFDTGGNALSAFAMTYGLGIFGATVLNLRTSTITLSGSGVLWDSSSATVNGSSATIILTYAGATATSFNGHTTALGNIQIAPGSGVLAFAGAFTFANMTMSSAGTRTVKFVKATTYTMTGTNFLAGTAGNLITIDSDDGATQFTLMKSGGGTVNADYVKISNSAATPANTWKVGPSSSLVSNDSGWTALLFPSWILAVFCGRRGDPLAKGR